jgi:hypothetical protein
MLIVQLFPDRDLHSELRRNSLAQARRLRDDFLGSAGNAMSKLVIALVAATALAGCANTFQVTTTAAPICGAEGAQQIALKRAAIETIRRGYDKFVIVGGQGGPSVVGHTPVYVYGSAAYGGAPMVAHGQGLKVFRDGDPAAENALSARQTLGPDWQEAAKKGTFAINCPAPDQEPEQPGDAAGAR